jgi:ATP-dependent Zn protease
MMAMQIKIIVIFAASLLMVSQKQTNRSVFIFADKADNANAVKQINILRADPKGIKNRDIVYTLITYSAANAQHYKKWGVANAPFTVILIGKDNGEKMRSHEPVTLIRLFDLIDNMPMRKDEIRYKN